MGDVPEDNGGARLLSKEAIRYRAITARLNYMSSDRIDLRYATKESSRHMSLPGELHMNSLGRLGRYLVGRPRLILRYRWQSMPSGLTTYTDSDLAGCPTTAKSTSGGIVCIGGHTVKSYSTTTYGCLEFG